MILFLHFIQVHPHLKTRYGNLLSGGGDPGLICFIVSRCFRVLFFILQLQISCGVALTDDVNGKYYDFDLSKLARQSIREQNKCSHIAPDNFPGPPTFVSSSQTKQLEKKTLRKTDFMPTLSNGK